MTRVLVTASVALNLLLLTSIVAARVDVARSRTAEESPWETAESLDDLDRVLESSANVAVLYAALRGHGFRHAATRPIVGAWLDRRQREALRREVVPYWLTHDAAVVEARLERIEHESASRRALVSTYGEAAQRDPYFAAVFAPLGPGFSFLTADEQAAVQHALASAAQLAVAMPPYECGDGMGGGPSELAGVELAPGAEVLGVAAAFEYGLRRSPLAEQLRLAGLELTEAEFRDAFGLMAELATAASLAEHLQSRGALRDRLGEARFDVLWARRDPIYPELRRLLERRGLGPDVIAAAYAVMNRAQESLLEAAQGMTRPEQLGELTREVVQRERATLEGLVGADAARALTALRTRARSALPSRMACGQGAAAP